MKSIHAGRIIPKGVRDINVTKDKPLAYNERKAHTYQATD
jgi:hypothetical protein